MTSSQWFVFFTMATTSDQWLVVVALTTVGGLIEFEISGLEEILHLNNSTDVLHWV